MVAVVAVVHYSSYYWVHFDLGYDLDYDLDYDFDYDSDYYDSDCYDLDLVLVGGVAAAVMEEQKLLLERNFDRK